jgi:hypothetical protein
MNFLQEKLSKYVHGKFIQIPSIAFKRYRPYPREASREILSRLQLRSKFICHVGQFESAGYPRLTLEAFGKIAHRPRFKSFDLLLMNVSQDQVNSLKARAETLGLSHRVCIVEKPSAADIPLLLSACSLAVFSGDEFLSESVAVNVLATGCTALSLGRFGLSDLLLPAISLSSTVDSKAVAEEISSLLFNVERRDSQMKLGFQLSEEVSQKHRSEFVNQFTKITKETKPLSTIEASLS